MTYDLPMEFLKRLADGIAGQFGEKCEVAIHDLSIPEHSLIYLVNGHISGRKVGDGPSEVVLRVMENNLSEDEIAYNMRTKDGRILRCTTIFLKNSNRKITGVFSINFDITDFLTVQNTLNTLTSFNTTLKSNEKPTLVTNNVEDLLEELISCAIKQTGSNNLPTAMSREEKMRALKFLSDSGAFLITGAGDRISVIFGISKFTIYNYLNTIKNVLNNDDFAENERSKGIGNN